MKRSLTFSQKILNLLVMQNQEQLINSFNKLSTNYYLREKNTVERLRTLRQTRIRLQMATKFHEVPHKEAELLLNLLKNEEELVLTYTSGTNNPILPSLGHKAVKMRWSGKSINLVEIIYGLHVSRCINGGHCDIKELVYIFENMFGIKLPHIYNRLLAIRNRKNGRTPFLRWLCEQIEQDANEKDK